MVLDPGTVQRGGYCAKLLDMQTSQIRVTPSEIGGFGGKTVVYLEPLAIKLSQMAGKPVKLVMSREEVFRGSGPTSAGSMNVKLGATKDGRIVAADFTVRMQAGATGVAGRSSLLCSFACYRRHVEVVGFDVVSNRPKVAAYRAPGSPVAAWGIESAINMLAEELGMDQIDLRLKNAREGTKTHYGPTFKDIGMIATLEAAKNSPITKPRSKPARAAAWRSASGSISAWIPAPPVISAKTAP